MTPLRITLTGSKGILAGLGRETLTIDLSQIPEDALTVALRGDNGLGKSTILNLGMVPWREPPMLTGNAYDQFGESGLRELEWTHNGTLYRSQIHYRNTGKAKTQKAYLHLWDQGRSGDGEWQPVTLPDHTTSDGKASTFDACLAHILGPQEVYYLSAFRAQNAPKLAEYDDPKGLMRALLNLDEPAELADKAKDVRRELSRKLDTLRDQTKALENNPERIVALESAIRTLDESADERIFASNIREQALSIARIELDKALAGDIDRQRILDERAKVQARLNGARNSAAAAIRQAEHAHQAAVDRLAAQKTSSAAAIATIEKDLADAQNRAYRAKSMLDNRDKIRAAEQQVAALTREIATQEQTAETLAKRVQDLRDLAAQVKHLETQRANTVTAGTACKLMVTDLTARAGFVSVVPCHGEGKYAECPALKDAMAAQDNIPAAQAEADALRAEWAVINDKIKEIEPKIGDQATVGDAHRTAVSVLASLRTKIAHEREVASQASALALAEQNLEDAQFAVAALKQRLEGAKEAAAEVVSSMEDEVSEHAFSLAHTVEQSNHTVELIQAELDKIPEPEQDMVVAKAKAAVADADTAAQQAKEVIAQALATKAQHQAEIEALRASYRAGEELLEQAKKLDAEIADWTLLAMGLRGVIDLSIEAAGPSIAAIANDLLAEAYGPRFSLRIVTQREQANGKTVEDFDISVIDGESGIESSIMHKSGGQHVIFDRCLTDAVALHQQDAAGMSYETTFADEADGALSADNRRMFYNMERRALGLGQYSRKYFVSHNESAIETADYIIDLANYRAAV